VNGNNLDLRWELKSLVLAIKRDEAWRVRLTRNIGWSLIVKLGLLTLLWALFFSSAHRCRVDGPATASRLALGAHQPDSRRLTVAEGVDRCD
jgi:hypothetical protein